MGKGLERPLVAGTLLFPFGWCFRPVVEGERVYRGVNQAQFGHSTNQLLNSTALLAAARTVGGGSGRTMCGERSGAS